VSAKSSDTFLITHVIGGKHSKVGFGSVVCITTSKVVKLGAVCEDMVAVLFRKGKYIGVVGSAGTLRSVRKEESGATSEEDINNWPERSFANKVLCDGGLIITVIHVGGERCRSCMLAKISMGVKIFTKKHEPTVILDVTTRPVWYPAAFAASRTVPQGFPSSSIAMAPL